MKKLFIGLTLLGSMSSFAASGVPVGKYKGNIVGSEEACQINLKMRKDKVKAIVHSNRKRVGFSNWSYFLGDETKSATLEKGGMTEMCDYWDFCLFNTPLKTLYIDHDENGSPVSFELTTEKDWRDDSHEETIMNCENLEEV